MRIIRSHGLTSGFLSPSLPLIIFPGVNLFFFEVLRDDLGRFVKGHPEGTISFIKRSKRTVCKYCNSEIPGFKGLRVESGDYCNGLCYIQYVLRDWLRRNNNDK